METEVDFVKVQMRRSGSFMVTVPKQAAEAINLKTGEKLKVLLDKENKRIIYQKLS